MNMTTKYLTLVLISATVNLFSANVWSGYIYLNEDYIVADGDILEIAPGTVIRSAPETEIIVDGGAIIALGTPQSPIRFTSLEPESSGSDIWSGIVFYNAYRDTSYMDNCIIENIQRTADHGSIFIKNSIVKITNSVIQNNTAPFGSAVQSSDSYLYMLKNKILNNTVNIFGSAVYISHEIGTELSDTYLIKNLVMENGSGLIEKPDFTSGGILVFEEAIVTSYTLIQENDVIANSCLAGKAGGSMGGGIQIRTQSKYAVDVIGNKIMYNKADIGGGLAVIFNSSVTYPHNYKNNIISNNTSVVYSGGVFIDMDQVNNPKDIFFANNNIINNLNMDPETGSGGYFIFFSPDLGNFINVINCIVWNNSMAGKAQDFGSNPSVYPGNYVTYSNSTNYIEAIGNISTPSLFYRETAYYGADPYENYLRGDYHLSLESPCVDAGDPEMLSIEPDKTKVNMGAYGNTLSATTSIYTTVTYENNMSVTVPAGEVFKLDCSQQTKPLYLNSLTVEDGGQIFIKTSPSIYDPNIYINALYTQGRKIGDQYTTRIQRMTAAEQTELPYNILNIIDLNCTGAQFNNMAVSVVSADRKSILIDSHVYIDEYNANLTGINLDTPETDVTNNTVDNFGIGVYYGPLSKETKAVSRIGRITNNTINFDTSSSNKEIMAKGVVVEQSVATVENNTVNNPNEGIEACYSSSGRITNNTVNFDTSSSNKAGTNKKAIHIFDGSDWEVDHNKVYCDDALTVSISGIEVHNSSINCHYNIIRFGSYGTADHDRYGFFTENLLVSPLSEDPIFINNTVYNSDIGFEDIATIGYIELYNNIFYGPSVQTYITGTNKNIILHNNDIVGEINSAVIYDDQYNINYDPYLQSSKVNDFYLWDGSKCIDAGEFVSQYHVYGSTFYGEAPDMGAIEFYQESNFYAPQNLTITANSTTMTISWSSVPDAVSYTIYGSADPYDTFTPIKSTTNTYWSASTTSYGKYFYYVTANRDGVKIIPEDDPETEIPVVIPADRKKIRLIKNNNSNK